MKHCRRQNENRCIDEKREHQSAGRVDCCESNRLTFALRRLFKLPRLHNRRVKIEIMWHDRGSDDADADVKHLLVHDDVRARHKTGQHTQKVWFGQDQLGCEASGDGRDQNDNKRFDVTKTFLLKVKNSQHIERSNAATPHQRDTEEKLQGDGRADHFGKIARGDRDLTKNPKKPNGRR